MQKNTNVKNNSVKNNSVKNTNVKNNSVKNINLNNTNVKNNNLDNCPICKNPICSSKKCIDNILNKINLSDKTQLNKNKNKNDIKNIKLDEIFIHDICRNKFHKSCIIKWFEISKTKKCPICREVISSDDPNIIRVFQNQNRASANVELQRQNRDELSRFPFNQRINVFEQLSEPRLDDFYHISRYNFRTERYFQTDIFYYYIRALRNNELFSIDDDNNNILIVILKNFRESGGIFVGCINYLINRGININQTNQYGECPLSVAFKNENFKIVRLLIEKNANINININENPFIIELIERRPTNNSYNSSRTRSSIDEIFKLCFDKITDINIIKTDDSLSLLMLFYVYFKESQIFDYYFDKIIEKGANLNIQSKEGYTILMFAIEDEDISTVKKLLNNSNIDINLKDNEGDTALDIALRNKYRNSINLLIKDNRLKKNNRLLNSAVLSENKNIVQLLITEKFPIKKQSWKNYSKEKVGNKFTKTYRETISKLLYNYEKSKK